MKIQVAITYVCVLALACVSVVLRQHRSNVELEADSVRIGHLIFVLSTRDSTRADRQTFGEKEKIFLSLAIENLGNYPINIWPWNYPITSDRFLSICRIQIGGDTLSMPKSYQLEANTKDLRYEKIEANGEIEYLVPLFAIDRFKMPLARKGKVIEERFYTSSFLENGRLEPGIYLVTAPITVQGKTVILKKQFQILK